MNSSEMGSDHHQWPLKWPPARLEDISIKQERHEAVLRPPQEEVSPLKIITAMPAALSPRRAAFVVFGIELHLNDSHSFKY